MLFIKYYSPITNIHNKYTPTHESTHFSPYLRNLPKYVLKPLSFLIFSLHIEMYKIQNSFSAKPISYPLIPLYQSIPSIFKSSHLHPTLSRLISTPIHSVKLDKTSITETSLHYPQTPYLRTFLTRTTPSHLSRYIKK